MKKIGLSLICFIGLSCVLSANDAIPIINTVFYGLDVLSRPRITVYVNGTYVDPYSYYYYSPAPVYYHQVPPPPPLRYYPTRPIPSPPRPIPPRHEPGRGSHPGNGPSSSSRHPGHRR